MIYQIDHKNIAFDSKKKIRPKYFLGEGAGPVGRVRPVKKIYFNVYHQTEKISPC